MKPKGKKPETIYRIINTETGKPEGSYSRACCDEYDFSSIESARNANCHGIFKDKAQYNIAQYKVTYELIDNSVDPPSKIEIEEYEKNKELEKKMDELGLHGFDRLRYLVMRDTTQQQIKE